MDHSFFLAAGLPVLTLGSAGSVRHIHHHAITDTYDKVDRRERSIPL